MIEDQTVQIPALPRESSTGWLGACACAAGLSWVVTLVSLAASEPKVGLLIVAGLGVSVTVSIGSVAVWTRYSLAKTTAKQHSDLQLIVAGQHVLTMAELRGLRTKITDISNRLPGYWHGVADTVEQMTGTEDNVRHVAFGRATVPPTND